MVEDMVVVAQLSASRASNCPGTLLAPSWLSHFQPDEWIVRAFCRLASPEPRSRSLPRSMSSSAPPADPFTYCPFERLDTLTPLPPPVTLLLCALWRLPLFIRDGAPLFFVDATSVNVALGLREQYGVKDDFVPSLESRVTTTAPPPRKNESDAGFFLLMSLSSPTDIALHVFKNVSRHLIRGLPVEHRRQRYYLLSTEIACAYLQSRGDNISRQVRECRASSPAEHILSSLRPIAPLHVVNALCLYESAWKRLDGSSEAWTLKKILDTFIDDMDGPAILPQEESDRSFFHAYIAQRTTSPPPATETPFGPSIFPALAPVHVVPIRWRRTGGGERGRKVVGDGEEKYEVASDHNKFNTTPKEEPKGATRAQYDH